MRKVTYLGVFEPSGTGYGGYFPDLPGCISSGSSFEEARKEAEETLGLHLYGMEKDGEYIPTQSASIEIDLETAAGYLVSPVTVYPDLVRNEDNRRVKTDTTIPAWLKDAAEQRGGVNYSRLLETALLDYLGISFRPGL